MASARASGLAGGAGDDFIETSGRINVRAGVTAGVLNEASSGASITSDNEVGAITRADSEAIGLAAGDGTNFIVNGSDLAVAADSVAYAFAYASGASVSFDGDGLTRAESHANAIATLLNDDPIRRMPAWLSLGLGLAAVVLTALAFWRFKPVQATLVAGAGLYLYLAVTAFLFARLNFWLPAISPAALVALTAAGGLVER